VRISAQVKQETKWRASATAGRAIFLLVRNAARSQKNPGRSRVERYAVSRIGASRREREVCATRMPAVSATSLTGGSAGRTVFVLLNVIQPARCSKPDALKLNLKPIKPAAP
jgi:hypothetical protein